MEEENFRIVLRDNNLHTVCEEASCPNIGECFSGGTATFMILGDICTRRCPFCDVAHGKPLPPDPNEPENLARTIAQMKLRYVVVTSVDRDDLPDGGAQHFVDCIRAIRAQSPQIKIEILVPDFRGRLDVSLKILREAPPDVMNHNLETVPRLYKQARPGSDYQHSLDLLKQFSLMYPDVPTKSGLMLGLGETDEEIIEVMRDLRGELVVGGAVGPGHRLQAVLRRADAVQLAYTDLLAQVRHLRPVGDGREGVVAVRQHQRVRALFMGEEPEDAFLFQQPRDEGEIALAVLHAILARLVAAAQRQLEVGEAVGLEDRGNDVAGGEVLEHPVVAGQGQPPQPGTQNELVALGAGVGGELVDFGNQGVEGTLLAVIVKGAGDVGGNGAGQRQWRVAIATELELAQRIDGLATGQ